MQSSEVEREKKNKIQNLSMFNFKTVSKFKTLKYYLISANHVCVCLCISVAQWSQEKKVHTT